MEQRNIVIEANRKIDAPKLPTGKELGLVFAAFFFVLSLVPLLKGQHFRFSTFWASLVFLAVAFLFPKILQPFGYAWLKFGLLLHKIMNPLILGIVFFLIFSPMAMLLRLFGKKFLQLGWDSNRKTYWILRSPAGPEAQSLKQQF